MTKGIHFIALQLDFFSNNHGLKKVADWHKKVLIAGAWLKDQMPKHGDTAVLQAGLWGWW
jgi:hypothetical protein